MLSEHCRDGGIRGTARDLRGRRAWRRNSRSNEFLLRPAAFPGCTPTESLPKNIFPKQPGPAALSLTTTTTAGWTFISSTAASAIFTRLIRRCATRCIETTAMARSRTSPKRLALAAGGFGQGVAVGDYDRDGFPDLYVTQYGRSILYHNNGDGTFTDVTEKAGVAAPGWASSAVWFDYDNDGLLDLFVWPVRAISAKKRTSRAAFTKTASVTTAFRRSTSRCRAGCFTTMAMAPLPTFRNRLESLTHPGKAWGVVASDINNDGWMDLFVTNDTVANFLFVNNGKGKFTETGTEAGVAFSANGRARSGMGVDAADFNEDGWQDLFVANIDRENFAIYQNNHDDTFDDLAIPDRDCQGHKIHERLGPEVFRLRQRRRPRSVSCQRQSRRPDRVPPQ